MFSPFEYVYTVDVLKCTTPMREQVYGRSLMDLFAGRKTAQMTAEGMHGKVVVTCTSRLLKNGDFQSHVEFSICILTAYTESVNLSFLWQLSNGNLSFKVEFG